MKYYENLINIIKKGKNLEKHLINPWSFLYISDFYYCSDKKHKIKILRRTNLPKLDLSKLKDFDKIFVDCSSFNKFVNVVLPKINKKIILITAKEKLPQIHISNETEEVLKNDKILLWFSQNPIYPNSEKFIAIPYGISEINFKTYSKFLLNNINKKINVSNLPVGIHDHLPENHIRRKYDVLGIKSGKKLSLNDFYQKIKQSKFIISTTGDREDCYRHYEAIGLGTMPISDVSENYQYLFGNNMIYKNGDEMIKILKNNGKDLIYQEPNKDLICSEYYYEMIKEKLNQLRNL